VLSAIVINAVWGLVHPREFLHYRAVRRNDGIAAVVALVGVLAVGPLNGLLVAIGQSLLGMIYRSVQVHVDEMGKVAGEKAAWGAVDHDPSRKTVRGVVVLRADSLMFWANVDTVIDRVYERVDARPDARVVLLDMEATNQLDTTTADRMDAMLTDLRSRGIDLYLVRVFAPVRLVLTRTGFLDRLGDDHLWHSISAGVKAAKHAVPLVPTQGRPDPGPVDAGDEAILETDDSLDDNADEVVDDTAESGDDERIAVRRSRPVSGG
jgi:MFS superfamily sulfate permease-like transporter